MTSIKILVQRQADDSSRGFVRINLLWAIGATLCPVFLLQTLRNGDLRKTLYPLALLFALLASWAILQGDSQKWAANRECNTLPAIPKEARWAASWGSANFVVSVPIIPKSLIVLIMLTTGV